MHLLSAELATSDDLDEAIDLGQSPGDVVIISAAETELTCFAKALALEADFPHQLRLANLLQLSHPMSVDLYIDAVIAKAKFIVLRLLGGKSYWSYGLEQIQLAAAEHNIPLLALPGDDKDDGELRRSSNQADEIYDRVWLYCRHGGIDNARQALRYVSSLIRPQADPSWIEPRPLLPAGLYLKGVAQPGLNDLAGSDRSKAAIIFYRALYQAGQLAIVDALTDALAAAGLTAVPLYVSSLKDPTAAAIVEELITDAAIDVVLNATGFAIGKRPTVLEASGAPVIQIVMSGGEEQQWRERASGLSPRDLAMHVVLPELDGRIMSRAISFKGDAVYDPATQIRLTRYVPVSDRVDFVVQLAQNWATLRCKKVSDRRVAVVLANYPTKDSRLANGVGLDTPQSAVNLFAAMTEAGYGITDHPASGNALIEQLQTGITNSGKAGIARITMKAADYQRYFKAIPSAARKAIEDYWGPPPAGDLALAMLPMGQVITAIQPARGYDRDPEITYHSPDLIPTHEYLAFYFWLRHEFAADAVIHLGKHGNLEWLPGKSVALSETCWPEIAFGPLPQLYPFIVNDPGEGSQAKRRTQAVIIDHLTPPMTRAETYGDLIALERLVDEYYAAASLDPKRIALLKKQILAESERLRLSDELNWAALEDDGDKLQELDNHLCEIKELQIRDGLHIFGQSPQSEQRRDLITAMARLPRHQQASLHQALARDLALDFDPLDCVFADPWTGPKPAILADLSSDLWRTHGDTVERLELLAQRIVESGTCSIDWHHTQAVLPDLVALGAAIDACGAAEIAAVLRGLDGRFVEPGPSGAPTRGRADVLPTGRNFYSLDSRALPTATAWQLGWKSASRVIDLYTQTHGDWPKTIAVSAWGTANMRTGGDDLAQVLALMGAKPVWDGVSGRVTGIEILPLSVLGRPRVDVTLRVSGFFRDAFPAQIELIDDAVRKIAGLDEPAAMNPLAATALKEAAKLMSQGVEASAASRLSTARVFGSKPGAYGAGLQALIDSSNWHDDQDLAEAYLAWGGFAYGRNLAGTAAEPALRARLQATELVLHNQDNREHDILDSDDYYQFEGGLAASIRHLKGSNPEIYHNDHSRPDNPKIRPLAREIATIVRGRAANPKWLKGVMRHGYKGAFEIAATLDYLFAFSATTRLVQDQHFDQLYDAYFGDDEVRDFIDRNNPDALVDMALRFDEAIRRNLWQPGRNSVAMQLQSIIAHTPNGEPQQNE